MDDNDIKMAISVSEDMRRALDPVKEAVKPKLAQPLSSAEALDQVRRDAEEKFAKPVLETEALDPLDIERAKRLASEQKKDAMLNESWARNHGFVDNSPSSDIDEMSREVIESAIGRELIPESPAELSRRNKEVLEAALLASGDKFTIGPLKPEEIRALLESMPKIDYDDLGVSPEVLQESLRKANLKLLYKGLSPEQIRAAIESIGVKNLVQDSQVKEEDPIKGK